MYIVILDVYLTRVLILSLPQKIIYLTASLYIKKGNYTENGKKQACQ